MSVPHDGEALHVMVLPRHGKIARLAAAPVSQANPFRPDRHRRRCERAATRTPRAAVCRPPAGSKPSRASMSATSPRGVAYMASLSLDANVQFMTVMATKMPYIGRG